MAVYIHCNFNSEVLRMATDVNILIPDNDRVRQFREKTNVPVKYQTLYLLHGFSCDYTYYLRKTNIERYADEHQIMVVMPSMYSSAYTDMKYGLEYYTYLSEELLDFVERTFPASAEKENRFVAGMSMGGYGAYKFGLSCPEKFAAVAGIAGSYHAEHRYQGKVSTVSTLCEALYGDPPEITPEVHDIFTLLERLSKSGQKIPRLYICCGTEDGMYRNSEDLKKLADQLEVPMVFEQGPGKHDDKYCDMALQRILDWMDFKGKAGV